MKRTADHDACDATDVSCFFHDGHVVDTQHVIRGMLDTASRLMLAWTCWREYAARRVLPLTSRSDDAKHVVAHAARAGHLHLTRWLLYVFMPRPANGYTADEFSARVLVPATEGGQVQVLEHYWAKVASDSNTIVGAAARGGHVHMLQHVHARVTKDEGWTTSRTWFAMRKAATHGRIAALEWLYALSRNNHALWQSTVLEKALARGQLEVAEWTVTKNAYDFQYDGIGWFRHAVEQKNAPVVQWLLAHGCEVPWDSYLRALGHSGDAWKQHFEWIQQHVPTAHYHDSTMDAAAGQRRLDCVQWLHEAQCGWGSNTLVHAVRQGDFAMLRYALSHGCNADGFAMLKDAIWVKALDMVQCLVDEFHFDVGLTLGEQCACITLAAKKQAWPIVKWLATPPRSFPCSDGDVWKHAQKAKDKALLKWLLAQDCSIDWSASSDEEDELQAVESSSESSAKEPSRMSVSSVAD